MKIDEIINLNTLQIIQDNFSRATGFAVILTDFRGKPLLEYSGFSTFCRLVRNNDKYLHLCQRSDAFISIEAVRKGDFCIAKCHAGLVDFAVPIIVDDQYLGSMMCGQVRTNDDSQIIPGPNPQTPDMLKDPTLKKAYDEIPIIDYEKIQACAFLFQILLNNIVEKHTLTHEKSHSSELVDALDKAEQDLKNLEIKYNTSQLNPHFLFNALNTAGRQAHLENATKTQEIIYSLADIMRNNLEDSGLLISIEKELKNIDNYIFVQTARFGENLHFTTNIDNSALKHKIPAMLILNLVENAVGHGLETKKGKGNIDLQVSKKGAKLHITVKDDGAGIEPELLKTLNSPNHTSKKGKKNIGIGIANTKQRLSYFFLEDYKFNITSELGKGTSANIIMPIL